MEVTGFEVYDQSYDKIDFGNGYYMCADSYYYDDTAAVVCSCDRKMRGGRMEGFVATIDLNRSGRIYTGAYPGGSL